MEYEVPTKSTSAAPEMGGAPLLVIESNFGISEACETTLEGTTELGPTWEVRLRAARRAHDTLHEAHGPHVSVAPPPTRRT
jgi:hypothetical protein